MNVLDGISQKTKKEVLETKSQISISELEKSKHYKRKTISLKNAIINKNHSGQNAIICEFKRKSPSKGIILENADLIEITQSYQKNGAVALSVLTSSAFEGNIIDIELIRESTQIPILRKEFIVDEYQIFQAKAIGSDAILLIAAILDIKKAKQLTDLAHQLGLEVLLEIHHQEELEFISIGMDMLGINNRNLKTFEVSLDQSINLMKDIQVLKKVKQLDINLPIISESGIYHPLEIKLLKTNGFDGYLIGESLMKSQFISEDLTDLIHA